jgi:hypothetical protein
MNDDNPAVRERLVVVLNSILCPIAGCWPLHGCHHEYYFDSDAEAHVLEVWPVGIEEPEEHDGNGHHESDPALLYELAEFDFLHVAKEISADEFHFSQRRSIFEIAWKERGDNLELRIHIVPAEVADDI